MFQAPIGGSVSLLTGVKAMGRATLIGGTVNVVPGPAVNADDAVLILDSVHGAAPGAMYVAAMTAGVAGVGNFDLTSTAGADVGEVVWVLVDTNFGG